MSRIKPILLASSCMAPMPPGETLDAIGEFVVDVAGGDHRLFAFRPGAVRDAVEDSAAAARGIVDGCVLGPSAGAFRRFCGIVAVTRKPPVIGIVRMCSYLHYSKFSGGFRVFFWIFDSILFF